MTNLYASDVPWCLEPLLLQDVPLSGLRPNLLINCSPADSERVAADLAAWCAPPVLRCSMPGPLDLPSTPPGTLVLTGIETMALDQQLALFDWMTTTQPRTQIVSVVTRRRPARPQRHFLEALFHRIGVLQLDAWRPVRPGYHPRLRPLTNRRSS